MLIEYYNESLSLNLSKKHFNYYFKGFDGASYWRKKFMQIENAKEIFPVFDNMEKEINLNLSRLNLIYCH